jgi:hypothetical protein
MVQLHESDLGQGGWSKFDWDNYELWEAVEARLKRRRRLWMFGALFVFLMLSAVPIVMDRWPKWKTRNIARRLAQELNWVKREAGVRRAAYRFRLTKKGTFDFSIERLASCDLTSGEQIRVGSLVSENEFTQYTWVTDTSGVELGIPGVVSDFCYDSLDGSASAKGSSSLAAFVVAPVSDLTEKRLDRLTILLISGSNGEISFD